MSPSDTLVKRLVEREPMLRYFEYMHLPDALQRTSRHFSVFAHHKES